VSRPIRVFIIEDNEVFREALELLLGLRGDVEVVGTLADGNGAASVVSGLRPDVVLLDYRLPGLNGVEVTREIVAALPDASVICLTASVTAREVEELEAAGAYACLTKDGDLDLIVATIREAVGPLCNGATA